MKYKITHIPQFTMIIKTVISKGTVFTDTLSVKFVQMFPNASQRGDLNDSGLVHTDMDSYPSIKKKHVQMTFIYK